MEERINEFIIDFVGIGAPKSGTSWLYECLNEHPGICMSKPKETYFFSTYQGIFREYYEEQYSKGLQFYKNYFRQCNGNVKLGEFCVSYLYDVDALLRIKKHFPKIKIIVALRDPSERTYSHYLHFKSKGVENKTFEQAIKDKKEYLDWSRYSGYLEMCFKIFKKENVHVVLMDEIKSDPEKIIKNLYEFLEVDNTYLPSSLNKKFNTSKNRMTKLYKLSKSVSHRYKNSIIMKIISKILFKLNLFYTNNKSVNKYKLDEDLRTELLKNFIDDINKLEKLLNKDLTAWK